MSACPIAPPPHALLETDREAFGRAFERHAPRLRAVALRVTKDVAAAEDVVQAGLEKALRTRAAFRGEALLSTWLHRIVVNEALMWLRTEKRRSARFSPGQGAALAEEPDTLADVLTQLVAREEQQRVRQRFRELAPREREVLTACVIEEESYAHYGARIGLRATAAKSRAFRAREALRRRLPPG